MTISTLCIAIYEAVRYWYNLMSGFDTVSRRFLFTFMLVTLLKFKYPIMVIMLHLAIAGCDMPHQIARVSHRHQGCFGSSSTELTLYELKGSVIAELGDFGEKKQIVKLSKEQLQYFYQFVSELKNLKEEGGCTSIESYRLVMNGDIYTLQDGSCHWNGFRKLYTKLFAP